MNIRVNKIDKQKLHDWFIKNQRPLPWRAHKDPYKIWISEIMLQQTTTTAVKPFFTKFIKRFPTVKKLAQANIEDIYEFWAGLGYYSRARNLKKSAQLIYELGYFPNNFKELLTLPGIGPYTSRAISSIAFGERAGVIDGNVIRILTRKYNLKYMWWKTAERNKLQDLSDQFVSSHPPDVMNQALMELGATICTPKNPTCLLCPWLSSCNAKKSNTITELPLMKPKAKKQIILWKVDITKKNSTKIILIKNNYAPFLKNQWLMPGEIKVCESRPSTYDLKHNITKYDIYVQIKSKTLKQIETKYKKSEILKADKLEVKKVAPSSVIQKIINH